MYVCSSSSSLVSEWHDINFEIICPFQSTETKEKLWCRSLICILLPASLGSCSVDGEMHAQGTCNWPPGNFVFLVSLLSSSSFQIFLLMFFFSLLHPPPHVLFISILLFLLISLHLLSFQIIRLLPVPPFLLNLFLLSLLPPFPHAASTPWKQAKPKSSLSCQRNRRLESSRKKNNNDEM